MQLSDKSIVRVVLHPGSNWSFDYCDDGSPFEPQRASGAEEEHFASFAEAVADTRKSAEERQNPMAAAFALVVCFDSSSDDKLRVTVWVRLGGGAQRILTRVQLPSYETNNVAVKFQENAPAAHASTGQLRLFVQDQECIQVSRHILFRQKGLKCTKPLYRFFFPSSKFDVDYQNILI